MRANLKPSIGYRQRVVKHTGIREITHAETIEPLQRADVKLPILPVFDAHFAGKHTSILIKNGGTAADR